MRYYCQECECRLRITKIGSMTLAEHNLGKMHADGWRDMNGCKCSLLDTEMMYDERIVLSDTSVWEIDWEYK